MLRLNIASNTNRTLLKVCMVANEADVKRLISLAKDKLQLKGVKGLYIQDGRELTQGDELHADMLLLAHRGEDFIGKCATAAPSKEESALPPLLEPVQTPFERVWHCAEPVDKACAQLRALTFNMLAPCLAQGVGHAEYKQALSMDEHTPPRVQHYARYAEKPASRKQVLSHNFQCDQTALTWEHRFPRLQSEILRHGPDLICLQELDATSWGDCQRCLQANGYGHGVCSRAKGGANNFIAMFWREELLCATQEAEIVYLKTQGTITAIMQRLTLRSKTAPVEGGSISFLAVTTHLKAGLKERDEQDRAKQVNDLLEVLRQFARADEDVVFAGDFNAHLDDVPFFTASGAQAQPSLKALVLPQLLHAGFSCAVRDVTGGKPLAFSQWCSRGDIEIRTVIDHVLLRGPRIVAQRALMSPDEAAVAEAGCLPNASYPSDHIPIVVDIAFQALATASTRADTGTGAEVIGLCTREFVLPQAMPGIASEKDLLCIAQDLPHQGRVAVTEDGFKYIELPKQWQASRAHLTEAAAGFAFCTPELLDADKKALSKQLACRHIALTSSHKWGLWSPTSHVGLHVSLAKHANSLNVGKRVRFQIKKLLHFQTRKLGERSGSGGSHIFCARWFTLEVNLIDEVRCEGEEPHISFAVFGVDLGHQAPLLEGVSQGYSK